MREDEPRPEGDHPGPQGLVAARPASRNPAGEHLEGEVDEHRNGEVLAPEALLDHLQLRRGVVRCPADLGEEVEEAKRLDVCKQRVSCRARGNSARHARLSLQMFHIVV